MRLLLDTHVVIWAQAGSERLGVGRELIRSADERWMSAAAVWELAIKTGLGKLTLPEDTTSWASRTRRDLDVKPLDVTASHAGAVQHLPLIHKDPFDRLMVAQAAQEGLTFLTFDSLLQEYGDHVRVIG